MRITIVGHSCLRIATRAGTILVDPWLFGSCYWRSWWHYPPSLPPDEDMLRPDFVYLTHHHFDHFHYPSLRRIDRSARILVPRFGIDAMAAEVTGLGFAPPRELPHGQVVDLGSGVRIASFQYGFDDTAFVVAEDDDVAVNLNDAKTRGLALRQIRGRFGRPAIAFKSHSFAQSYPLLYSSADPADLSLIDRDTFIDDFVSTMQVLQPRYAVPFGSMVCFLHPESRPVNRSVVTPPDLVAEVAARTGGGGDVSAVAMAPGDSWSSVAGLDLQEADWYSDRDAHLDRLAAAAAPAIADQSRSERRVALDWPAFADYFGAFVTECPWLLARRLVPRRVVFHVPSDRGTPWWWVSFRDRTVGRSDRPPDDRAGTIHVAEAVLADAIEKRIVYLVHISMRLRVELAPGGLRSDLAFWGLLGIWEFGYLPLRCVVFRPRFWAAAFRRWREGVDVLWAVLGRDPVGGLAKGFSARVDGRQARE